MNTPAFHVLPFILSAALLLSACDRSSEPDARVVEGNTVAMVNGVAIGEADFQEFLDLQRMSRLGENLQPEQVLDEMVNMELLRQAAQAQGLDRDPDILRQVERSRTNLMVGALIDRQLAQDYTDGQLQAEYERQIEGLDRQEYKARHILVDNEEAARSVIEALNQGDDFQEVAEAHATGPAGPMGGDLGWFVADAMVPTFADAVRAMEKGSHSSEPVQTEFGWHVILLEDVREAEPPPFEMVRDRVAQILDSRRLQDYIDDLRNRADIEIKQ